MRKAFVIYLFLPLLSYGGSCKAIFEFKKFLLQAPRVTMGHLSLALESSDNLYQHLRDYSINDRAIETGDTLLHVAVQNFREDHSRLLKTVLEDEEMTLSEVKSEMLGIVEKNRVIDHLLLLSAST